MAAFKNSVKGLNGLMRWWRIEPMEGAHFAYFYGVPAYFVDEGAGCQLAGRNRLYDALILYVMPTLHNYLIAPFFDYGFPIKVGPRVDGREE